MNDLEVPNDWGVTRRQNHQTTGVAKDEEVPKNRKHAGDLIDPDCPLKKKKKIAEGVSKKLQDAQDQKIKTGDSLLLATAAEEKEADSYSCAADEDCEQTIVTKGPLGPKGLFNAVNHDVPERGQLKQIVMMQLTSSKQTSSGAANKNNQKDDVSVVQDEEADSELQMEVHCLLSKLPYQKMLSDLFSVNDKDLMPNPNIPFVSRVYEESFMREPLNSTERLCAKGEQCECMFIDQENPFVCIEFLLPGEKQPASPHLCVVCCRAVTQQLYYDIMFDKHDFGGVIQRFGNIHSQPGEYALDAMLIAAPSVPLHIMPLPIVSHQRNRYSVYNKHGIKHLRQSRVYFQNTPSC